MTFTASLFSALAMWLLTCRALAIQVEALDPSRDWRVEKVEISGNQQFPDNQLLTEMVIQARPWYRFWEERPLFDPLTFATDLDRLRRFYQSEGYYKSRITHNIDPDETQGLVSLEIYVEENSPVVISQVLIEVNDEAPDRPPLPEKLPIKPGEIFREQKYQDAELLLRNHLMDNGHAHAQTQRRAEVDLEQDQAGVRYSAQPGPKAVFGETEIKGTEQVEPYLVVRELAYEPGEMFSLKKIRESRQQILALDLFSGLRINPRESAGTPTVVPMEVQVTEKPPRQISVGLGYSTEEEFHVSLDWRYQNWLGDGRRLWIRGKYSSIVASGDIDFTQPHFFTRRTQAGLHLRHAVEEEETFKRTLSRFSGRLEHRFTPRLLSFFGYRVENNQLSDVADATTQVLGEIRTKGILTGPSLGLVWNSTDDLLQPTQGEIVSFNADQAGGIWGGPYEFFKLTGEAKKYFPIGWDAIFAGRLKLGVADAIGSKENYPLFERFFAGGQGGVRGYGRRRLGPLNSDDEPLGGLSLIEGSVEVRRPVWRELGGALFVDFGQVSLKSFDIPVNDLQFSTGFGLSYTTPVGPLRLDIGFPFKPPRGDRAWQIHFSVGASF
jgi:outer membrane protein assembly complex protein YaeT